MSEPLVKPGESLWYRDNLGLPTKVTVDHAAMSVGMIFGISDRLAFVRRPIRSFYETLDDCERQIVSKRISELVQRSAAMAVCQSL